MAEAQSKTLNLTFGAIAGVVSRTFVAPVERIIIMKQTKASYVGDNIITMLMKMWQREGLASWFKGNWANCVRIAPFQAIEFFFFDFYKHLWHSQFLANVGNHQNSVQLDLLAGALSGATATTMVYPLDIAKTHLAINVQNADKTGVLGTINRIRTREGYFALYKGLGASIIGMTPYASLKLTSYNQLTTLLSKDKKVDKRNLHWTNNILLGGISGCFAVSITYPTDLIRRRIQVYALASGKSTVGLWKVIKEIHSKDGFRGFYSGLLASYTKIFPSTALAFTINDALKRHAYALRPQH